MLAAFSLFSAIVVTVVLLHYEVLFRATTLIPRLPFRHRLRIVFGVFAVLIAHALEIWIFAIAYYALHHVEGWGEFTGNFAGTLFDCGYFSFTTFTTLGFGDIEPIGAVRYLTGIEALTGLVLITWSASFLFFEMQRHWNKR